MGQCILQNQGGGTPIELTFSDGHTEKVNGKLCTGSKVLDTTTMIPLVFSGVGSTIDLGRKENKEIRVVMV